MAPPPVPGAPSPWPIPTFHFRIEGLGHPGAGIFLTSVRADTALYDAVTSVCRWLYTPETVPRSVQSVTLVLRPMDGVAHTFGSSTHKEIHFSLDHIRNSAARAKSEIMGVLTHEMVHCYQFNGCGQCPGGLIEGIADWVRSHAGLSAPHWKRGDGGSKWDAGYESTAYFLDWLEDRYGDGTVRELNESLRSKAYHRRIFKEVTGRKLDKLWRLYKEDCCR